MTAESLRIRGGGASTMPVWAFRNGTLLTPPSRRHTISASAFLHRHNSSPSSSSMCAFFVSLCISSFTPSVFPAAPRHNLRWRNLSGEGTIMTISKDRVVPFPTLDSSKLNESFATGGVLAAYQSSDDSCALLVHQLMANPIVVLIFTVPLFDVWARKC